MNIAFFSECYRPTRNGIVVSIDTFARYLQSLGHHVQIYAPHYRGYHDEVAHVSRVPAVRLPVVPEYPVPIPMNPGTVADFERRSFDLVHTHSVFTLSHVGAHLAARYDLPLVTTFHTMLLDYLHYTFVPPMVTRPFVVGVIRRFCSQCDLVIVPSSQTGQLLRGIGVETEIQPLPTGIDVEHTSRGDGRRVREELAIPFHHRILLYVGRIAREKNIEFLMEVAVQILSENADTDFVLVGAGPLTWKCESMVQEHGLTSRVHFVGSVPTQEVRDYYAAADIFVFASMTETQGLVIGEAMAAGLPVVAVRGGGVTEFISSGEDGFLVDENQAAFLRTIGALLTNTALHRSVSAAARRKAQQFSAEASTRRLEGFYQVLVESRRKLRVTPPTSSCNHPQT